MEEQFQPYESIKPGLMQWKCVICNGNVYHKLVLHYKNQSQESIYIDNDFGEYMLCSTYRINHQQRNEVTVARNKTVIYSGLEPFSYNPKNENKNTVLVRRIPASYQNEEIYFVDSQHMSRTDVIKVAIPPRKGFENLAFSVYSPFAAKLADPITEFKGRLYLDAKINVPGTVFEQQIDLALEVDQVEVVNKGTGKYDDNGNEIVLPYLVNVTVLYVINRKEFNMIKFFNPNKSPEKYMTIFGEAKVATYLDGPRYENNGQELFFSSNSKLFLKICKNKNAVRAPVQCTSELPRVGGKECYRTEIEVMAALKSGIDQLNSEGSNRIVLFNDVISDADNVYVILPYKQGLDANSMLNNYNLQVKSLSLDATSGKSEIVCKILLKNVSTALCFMHSLGISHNDIKLENIVSAAPHDSSIHDWVHDLAIVDFGQARRHFRDPSNSAYYQLPWLGIPGTPNYYCPETLQSSPYDGFKVDVFQLAMTIVYFKSSKLYEKFRKNFDEYKVFLSRLKAFGPVHFVALFGFNDPVLKALLIRMLDFNPITRISMQEVREALLD